VTDDPRVDRLLEELLESGGSPEEACHDCPELLPQVRAGLLRLRLLEQEVGVMFPPSDPPGGVRLAAPPSAEPPPIPGYEVEEELGRGGVGVVYRAHHLRLGRTVALKMLLAGPYARPEERERFQREAQALAALSHPNIVQVHEVAELDGQPYFTMEYLEGGSLAAKLSGTPLPPRETAGLSATLAGAVEAAHRSGIVHRDLKPANVLLAADGTPKITDFGLARRLEDGAGLTRTGFPVGTPSYMAPEQAKGEARAIGPAVDVYALGAILYELLTGRPPFRAETPTETVHQVIYHDPAPPSRLNARVPRELETICLKCLEKDPRRRYPTARALADDLRAWLAGRPIAARRVRVAERAWLWCRRKPAVAALAAAVALAVVGGTAATIAVQAAANRRLDHKNAELSDALGRVARANAELKGANARVEARYDLAVAAIKTFHTGVSKDFLLQQEQFQELRDQLLKAAADFYGRLSALLGQEASPSSRRALLAANFELASLTGMVGRTEAALAAHRAVLAAREALAAEPGAGAAARADIGRSLTEVAQLLEATGRTGEALATCRRAEALLAGAADSDPAARAALAACRSRLGNLLSRTGQAADALATYLRARADQEALAAAPGAPTEARRDLVDTMTRIGHLLSDTGRRSEAEAEYRRALEIQEKLAAENPAVTEFRSRLAGTHHNLGLLLARTGPPTEAEAEYRRALEICGKLAADHPAVTEFRSLLAATHHNLGLLLARTGPPTEAEAEYRRALEICGKLAADHPAVTKFRSLLANSHHNLGLLLEQTGRPTEAEPEYRRALELRRKLAADHPAVTEFRSRLAATHHNLGLLLARTGPPTEAEAEYRRALEICGKLAADHPAVTEFRSLLAASHHNLGLVLAQTGRPREAEAEYRRALEIQEKLAAENPAVTEFRSRLAATHNDLGNLLAQTGRPTEAEGEHRRALEIREKLAAGNPKVPGYRNDVASCHTNLSVILRRRGRPAEARDGCNRAIAIREALVKEDPKVPMYRSDLAWSCRRRGLARRDLGDFAGAAADARRAVALWDSLPSRTGEEWFETACARAALADLTGRDGSAAEAAGEAETAMALLHKAVAMGYRRLDAFRTEDALDPFRDRPDFRLLMMGLAMPADPFARSH
jgi:eukaryotic-like serine/threonine-protein kinase